MSEVKERPILFSAPMVRAIQAGTKTQTRRVCKGAALQWLGEGFAPDFVALQSNAMCPYGQSGDRLWVREAFQAMGNAELHAEPIFYRADQYRDDGFHRWTPSIHMPRWASRITLEIVSVRVERLNEISEQDAQAEGIAPMQFHDGRWLSEHAKGMNFPSATAAYRDLWESINGPGSWDANPWVWVVEFRKLP